VHRSVGTPKSRSALRQWDSGLHHTPRERAGPSAETRRKSERGQEPTAYRRRPPRPCSPAWFTGAGRDVTTRRVRNHRRGRSGVGTPGGIRLLLEGAFATARLRGRLPAFIVSIGQRSGVVPGPHSAAYTGVTVGARTCREGRWPVVSFCGSRCRLGGAAGCLPDLGHVPPSRALRSTRDRRVRPRPASSNYPHRTVTHV